MVFDKEKDTDPAQLAKMVEYVRKQVKYMDQLDSKDMIEKGSLSLLGLNEPYRTHEDSGAHDQEEKGGAQEGVQEEQAQNKMEGTEQ